MRRKETDQAMDECFSRAVQECTASIAQHVYSPQQRTVNSGAGGRFQIGARKSVFQAVPEEEFVAKHLFFTVEDGLPGYKAERLDIFAVRRRSCGGTFHVVTIGCKRENCRQERR